MFFFNKRNQKDLWAVTIDDEHITFKYKNDVFHIKADSIKKIFIHCPEHWRAQEVRFWIIVTNEGEIRIPFSKNLKLWTEYCLNLPGFNKELHETTRYSPLEIKVLCWEKL